jgi:tetratricopeptide (TPR) repeat protein
MVASVLRNTGQLLPAWEQALQIIESCEQNGHKQFELKARVFAADFANCMMQPELALSLLGDPPDYEDIDDNQVKGENDLLRAVLDYFCLQGEFFLERGEEASALESLSCANEYKKFAGPNEFARTKLRLEILGSRLEARSGNTETALKGLHAAVASANWDFHQNSGEGEIKPASQPGDKVSHGLSGVESLSGNLLAVGEAALEFGQWDLALYVLRKAGEAVPAEPLPFFKLARALVLRAETQLLCQDLEAVQHAPGISSLAEYARQSFEQTIDTAALLIDQWNSNKIFTAPERLHDAQIILESWKNRGSDVFSSEKKGELLVEVIPASPDAISSRISAHREYIKKIEDQEIYPAKLTAITAYAIHAARVHPQNPMVLAQLALTLALSEGTLPDALRAARQCLRNYKAECKFAIDSILPIPSDQAAGYHALLAILSHQCGEETTANEAIQAALKAWPGEPRWHALASDIFMANGDRAAAIFHLEQALALEPRYVHHYLALGEAYLAQSPGGRAQLNITESGLARAIQTLEHATSIAPENLTAWLTLAKAYLHADQIDQAASCAEKALYLSPQEPHTQLLVGEVAFARGNIPEAYERIQTAVQLSPDSQRLLQEPQAVLLRARVLDKMSRTGEALSVLEKAIPATADPLPLLLEEVSILERNQGDAKALELLSALADRFPDEPRVLTLLAFKLEEAGNSDEAARRAQKALQILSAQPEDVTYLEIAEKARLHLLLGRIMRRTGQLDQALHHLNEVIQQVPNDIEGYLDLGGILQERRQHPKALQMYQQATRIAPRDPRPYHQAGMALKESKDYVGAESMLRRAAELAPGDLSIHRQLGAIVALNLVHNRRRRPEE